MNPKKHFVTMAVHWLVCGLCLALLISCSSDSDLQSDDPNASHSGSDSLQGTDGFDSASDPGRGTDRDSDSRGPDFGNDTQNSQGDSDVDPDSANPPFISHNIVLYPDEFLLTLSAADENEIYYSIDGTPPTPELAGNGRVFKYTASIPVRDRNGEENLLATRENSEKMYAIHSTAGGDRPNTLRPYYPTNYDVPKATVISAIAVDALGKESQAATATFFIGDNLASYNNAPVISLVTDPANLFDTDKGIFVRGPAGTSWYGEPMYNFRNTGIAWERVAFLELFDSHRNVSLSTNAGIRVRGGWSRSNGQKSLNVYFREEYGGFNSLKNFQLIPNAKKADGTPLDRTKNFILRNGGNDHIYTIYRDGFCQYLLRDRSFSTQAVEAAVVYINGEYWGPYAITEKYGDNHTEYVFGVKKENVISYSSKGIDDGWPEEEDLYFDMLNMHALDMADARNYEAFCDVFDIENFIDYWAAEIYLFNQDWPENNYRLWRTRNVEVGNPFGDTKWRWQMYDVDYSLGLYSNGSLNNGRDDVFSFLFKKDELLVKLFRSLLNNATFRDGFVNALMDLYNVNFHPDSYEPALDLFVQTYRPLLLNAHYDRWLGSDYYREFDSKTANMRKYLNDMRGHLVNALLPQHFGMASSGLFDFTVRVQGGSGGEVIVNTVRPKLNNGSWTGKYYSSIPVVVQATPPAGYLFDGWEVSGGTAINTENGRITVRLNGNTVVTAKFR